MTRSTLYIIIGVIVILALAWWNLARAPQAPAPTATSTPAVASFEDCQKAGYPVTGANPRQCKTPDGRTYAEEKPAPAIAYKNASSSQIKVTLPPPGAVTGKTFKVTGEARGTWYFEASFPVAILGKDGKQLAATAARAQGDWMTENFVPFSADIAVPESYIGPATIVLKKDNPSGDPARDASASYPITIEY